MAKTKYIFPEIVDSLPKMLAELQNCEICNYSDFKNIPSHGIYVFYEKNKPLYVGRTNRMKGRLKEHGHHKSGHNKASFAFILAKEKAGKKGIDTYKRTRDELCKDEDFMQIFTAQRERVASMSIRFIEEEDPIVQSLLEIYAAIELPTKYNSFTNH